VSDRWRLEDESLRAVDPVTAEEAEVLEAEGRRAEYARQFLESDVYRRVVATLRANAVANFAAIPPSQVDALVECRRQLHALDSFEAVLQDMADTGKLAGTAHQP